MQISDYATELSPDLLAATLDERFELHPHSRLICTQIVAGMLDPDIDCVIVRTPPRVGKSTSVNWVIVWLLDWFPMLPLITIAYAIRLARRNSRIVRNIFLTYPDRLRTRLADDSAAAEQWETEEGGGLLAAGIGSAITGFDGAHILIDDPHKSWAEAQSAQMRAKVWEAFESDIESRRTRFKVGGVTTSPTIVIVATPMHPDDLSHRAERKYSSMVNPDTGQIENRCKVVHIPALADPEIVWPDPLGREPGESICEDMLPAVELRRRRENMAPNMFNSLYQGVCRLTEGGLVDRSWWAWSLTAPEPSERLVTFTSWDLTFGKTGKSWVVGQLWTITRSPVDPSFYNLHLLDQVRRKSSFTEQLLMVRSMAEEYPDAEFHLIEDKANGPALIDTLRLPWVDTEARDETGRRVASGRAGVEKRWPPLDGVVAVKATSAEGSKADRLANCSPMIRAGRVLLPSWWQPRIPGPGWRPRFPGDEGDVELSLESFAGLLNECAEIPNSATDDQADALSQAVAWSKTHMAGLSVKGSPSGGVVRLARRKRR